MVLMIRVILPVLDIRAAVTLEEPVFDKLELEFLVTSKLLDSSLSVHHVYMCAPFVFEHVSLFGSALRQNPMCRDMRVFEVKRKTHKHALYFNACVLSLNPKLEDNLQHCRSAETKTPCGSSPSPKSRRQHASIEPHPCYVHMVFSSCS